MIDDRVDGVIPFVSRGISKTLVDGTVRMTIDFEPGYGVEVMQRFGMPGTNGAIAALRPLSSPADTVCADETAQSAAERTVPATTPRTQTNRPAGAILAQNAAMLCTNEKFQRFCRTISAHDRDRFGDAGYGPDGSDVAAKVVRQYCKIESRSELNKNPDAAKLFGAMMTEYREWRELVGIPT